LRRQDRDAGHLQSDQSPNGVQRPLWIVIGVHDQPVHVVHEGAILKGGRDLGKKRITDVGDENAEQLAAPAGELSRHEIRGVAESRHRRAHAILGFGTDAAGPVEHVRDGRDRHTGVPGDILDAGHVPQLRQTTAPVDGSRHVSCGL
jgi:hypothetical protein